VHGLFQTGDQVVFNPLPHDSRHRFGHPGDLHPHLDRGRILPVMQAHRELVRVAASGESVVAIRQVIMRTRRLL
jgi:hypothetical protein